MYPIPVGASLLAMASCQPTWLLLTEYISIAAVTATYGFALTVDSLWQTPQRKQRSRPGVRPLAEARRSFAAAFIRGHRLPKGRVNQDQKLARLAARPPSLASQLPQGNGDIREIRSAVRPPSRSSQLPQVGVHLRTCRSCRVQRGCDLLIFKSKIKRSQPSAAPTGNRANHQAER